MNSRKIMEKAQWPSRLYREKFGPLPEGIIKHAANQGEAGKLMDGLLEAVRKNKPITNWDDYVTPFPGYL